MLSIKQMIKIDPTLASLSEAELEQLRADMYENVQLAYDVWWTRKGGSKNPVGSFTNPPLSGIVEVCKTEPKEQE